MKYFGGKSRIAKQLATYMQPFVDRAGSYVEPFVGGANVIQHVKCDERIACDANRALITMWEAVADGWQPPTSLSEAEYENLKLWDDWQDPLTAFAAVGCSFGGKWWGGYARGANKGVSRQYALESRNKIQKTRPRFYGVRWLHRDYQSAPYPEGCVIYCDPPYAGTTGYPGAKESFDSPSFWQWCKEMAYAGHDVFISEYVAPEDFVPVLSIPHKLSVRSKEGCAPRMEHLFAPRLMDV